MFIIGWLFFSVAAALFAQIRRDRSFGGWLLVALLFSPLVAFVLLAILQPLRLTDYERDDRRQRIKAHIRDVGIGLTGIALVLGYLVLTAPAQQQIIRDASGRTVSTATQSGNQTTYRDADGRSIGTGTMDSTGTMVIRDASGRTIGIINGTKK